jgi:radical SAM protein with 4Fe4S-binding SPASM domain
MKTLKHQIDDVKYWLFWRTSGIYDLFDKVRFFYFVLPKYRRKSPLFQHINIETTNICTKKCPFCYFGNVTNPLKLKVMSDKLFKSLIDQLADMKYRGRISLFEINEPLTDPSIFERVAYVKKKLPRSLHVMVTNGDLLTPKKLERLFQLGVDRIDLNAYNKSDLIRNKNLLKKAKYPKDRLIRYDKTQRFLTTLWASRGGSLDKYKKKIIPKKPCELVHVQMIIKSNGDVVGCANDLYRKQIMGNVTKQAIKDVWFGEKFETLRKNLNQGKRHKFPLCKGCDYGGVGGYTRHTKKK